MGGLYKIRGNELLGLTLLVLLEDRARLGAVVY